jgi:hypothetical protein
MTDLLPVDLQDILAGVDRELKLRRAVYPRWVSDGKMSQSLADRQIEVFEALRNYLAEQRRKEKP